jgi:hypothetical protein
VPAFRSCIAFLDLARGLLPVSRHDQVLRPWRRGANFAPIGTAPFAPSSSLWTDCDRAEVAASSAAIVPTSNCVARNQRPSMHT